MHATLRTPALSRAGLSLCFLVTLGCDSRPGVSPEPPAATPATIAPVAVTSVTPSTAFEGMPLRISGTGFLRGAVVAFGGVQAFANVISDTLITGTIPPHAPGAVDVVVTNLGGSSVTIPGGFVYATVSVTAAPTVVAAGGYLQVSWSTPISQSSLDWIGLFRVGDSNFAYLDYQYTNGLTDAALNWNAPSQAGQYEFRYLLNDEYIDVGRSARVTVEGGATAAGLQTLIPRAGRGGAPRRR